MRSNGLLLGLLALTLGVGCATNPATGKRQLMLISEAQEIQIGQENHQAVMASLGVYDDPQLQRYVSDLGMRLAKDSERPQLPWTFTVVDDPVVNAFALPGGFIYVTRGILAHFDSEAELVSVLGHEIGHVTGRHGANRMSKAQLAGVGLVAGAAISGDQRIADLAGTGLGLLFLKYSRDDERQADMLGYRYLTNADYDPRPMANVFTTLERVSQSAGAGRIPDWMATHPNPASRRQEVLARIDTHQGPLGDTVERDSYLQRLDGLTYGEDPRQGFFEDENFLHPDMRFRLRFPKGWKTMNARDQVAALSPRENGIVRLTLAPASSVDEAARAFINQEGVVERGSRRRRVHGLSAVEVKFEAQTQSGMLRGHVIFLPWNQNVFQIMGLATAEGFGAYERLFDDTLGSFRELTDRRALNVKPDRLEVTRLRQGGSVTELKRRYSSAGEVKTLELLNGIDQGGRLEQRQMFKYVVSGR